MRTFTLEQISIIGLLNAKKHNIDILPASAIIHYGIDVCNKLCKFTGEQYFISMKKKILIILKTINLCILKVIYSTKNF